ncbi:MAG: hypothetical protein WCL39_15685, partial [Armatimonadota bacterium]
VVGLFKHQDRSEWAMLVNRSPREEVKATYKLSANKLGLQMNSITGALGKIAAKGVISLSPGHSVLLKFENGKPPGS